MPAHDWTKVIPGIFHDFHQRWSMKICDALNDRVLPKEMYALVEQYGLDDESRVIPDVITLKRSDWESQSGGGTMLKSPPKKATASTELRQYVRKKNLIAIRHASDDEVVAMIEIISPGNKSGPKAIHRTVKKLTGLVQRGVHLLLIDLFPPTVKCGQSLHQILWEDWSGRELAFDPVPSAKPFAVMAYEVNDRQVRSYVEPFAFGDSIPNGTLFVEPKKSLSLPLDELYREAWKSVPQRCRALVESPVTV